MPAGTRAGAHSTAAPTETNPVKSAAASRPISGRRPRQQLWKLLLLAHLDFICGPFVDPVKATFFHLFFASSRIHQLLRFSCGSARWWWLLWCTGVVVEPRRDANVPRRNKASDGTFHWAFLRVVFGVL